MRWFVNKNYDDQREERLPETVNGHSGRRPCRHGKDTGRKWAHCDCHAIECRCPERLAQLRAKVIRDAVDFHTLLARAEDPYSVGYVLVREKWCTEGQCSYYIDK